MRSHDVPRSSPSHHACASTISFDSVNVAVERVPLLASITSTAPPFRAHTTRGPLASLAPRNSHTARAHRASRAVERAEFPNQRQVFGRVAAGGGVRGERADVSELVAREHADREVGVRWCHRASARAASRADDGGATMNAVRRAARRSARTRAKLSEAV
jgi:hypothetical protein